MNATGDGVWLDRCRHARIDPDEVRVVFARYDAYRRYTLQHRGQAIGLEQWFRFYRMEKASEGEQSQPAPAGCSVDSDAVNNACIQRPIEFLEVLKVFAGEQGID